MSLTPTTGSRPPVVQDAPGPDDFVRGLEEAHRRAVTAAAAGLSDAALGPLRLDGEHVATLADAALSSATPFLRAPLLARISAALLRHPPGGDVAGQCPTCRTAAPCGTAEDLRS